MSRASSRTTTPPLHHEVDGAQRMNVLERIGIDGVDIGKLAGREGADVRFDVEHLGGLSGRGLQRL
jgi:hypothetical protein